VAGAGPVLFGTVAWITWSDEGELGPCESGPSYFDAKGNFRLR